MQQTKKFAQRQQIIVTSLRASQAYSSIELIMGVCLSHPSWQRPINGTDNVNIEIAKSRLRIYENARKIRKMFACVQLLTNSRLCLIITLTENLCKTRELLAYFLYCLQLCVIKKQDSYQFWALNAFMKLLKYWFLFEIY